mgnify:FL=1
METSCSFGCQAAYNCSCGDMLCSHSTFSHLGQGHTIGLLPEKVRLNEVLSLICQKKRQVLMESQRVISEVQKLAFERINQLNQLRKTTNSSSTQKTTEILHQIQPEQLFSELINQLGFSNQLKELRTQFNQVKASCKVRKKELKKMISNASAQLREAKNENWEIRGANHFYEDFIENLKEKFQETIENYERENMQLIQELNEQSMQIKRIPELMRDLDFLVKESVKREIQSYEINSLGLELEGLNLEKAYCLDQLGLICSRMRDYANSEHYCLRSARIREAVLDPQSPVLATTYRNLGLVYKEMKKYSKSEEYYLKSLNIEESLSDSQDTALVYIYSNLGSLYYKMKNYPKSEEYHLRCLEMQKGVLDPYSIPLANTYHNLGALYCKIENYSESEDYYLKSLKISEAINGPGLEITRYSLRVLYQAMDNHEKSICKVF